MASPELLQKINLLSELGHAELSLLSPLMHERVAKKSEYILREDAPGPSLMFLVSGRVKVSLLSHDGKEIVLALVEAGEYFGELAVLTGEERSANVVALEECKLLVLGEEDFYRHAGNNSGLLLLMLKDLAGRLQAASGKIGDLALFDVYRRVARTLQSLAQKGEANGKTVLIIEKRPTHQELASLVGTSREMITRALKGLEEDGCIAVEGKTIEVRKMPL